MMVQKDERITETDLNYEKQLQEFAESINRGRKTKTRSRIVYTSEIRDKIDTLYKLGVNADTIQSLYLSHLYYFFCILTSFQNIVNPY